MKRSIKPLIVAIVIIVVAYQLFNDEDPVNQQQRPSTPAPTTGQQQQKASPATVAADKTVAKQGAVWPFIGSNSETSILADSLTRKNIVMIFDGSGSMQESGCSGNKTKITVAKQVVTEWADTIPADANLGLIVFDSSGFSVRLPLGINNRDQFKTEISNVTADQGTPLTQSLKTAYNMLTLQGQKQLGYGDYSIVIVTDGVANYVDQLEKAVDYVLQSSPIIINTIGFCIGTDHTLNTRGKTVYKAANNPEELRQGLQDILAESESFDISGFE